MSDGSWVSDGFMTQDSRHLKTLHADRWNDVGQEKEAKRQTLLEIVECAESWSRFTPDLLEMYWLYLDDFSEPLD